MISSRTVNISFALALCLPDLAAFVNAQDGFSITIAVVTWISIFIVFFDSLNAWRLFRPSEIKAGPENHFVITCELIGVFILAAHALTVTSKSGDSQLFIYAQWARSTQLPLLCVAGRRIVCDTKWFRNFVRNITSKKSASVAPLGIIPIDHSPPQWSMYHEAAQFAGISLVIVACTLVISLGIYAVEPLSRAKRSSSIQLSGCDSIASSFNGNNGHSIYSSLAESFKNEAHKQWSTVRKDDLGWGQFVNLDYHWGAVFPMKMTVKQDDGSIWSKDLATHREFVKSGRPSSYVDVVVGRCSLELSIYSSRRLFALLDVLTSGALYLIISLIVWGIIPGAPPQPEFDKDPLLGPLRRTWLRLYMVTELHSSLPPLPGEAHLTTSSLDEMSPPTSASSPLSSSGISSATSPPSPVSPVSTPTGSDGDTPSSGPGQLVKRGSWVSRTIPVGERRLIREVSAMTRGLVKLNISLDAVDDETGGMFGRITKSAMFGTEDHLADESGSKDSDSMGLDEQTKWLLEGFTRADRDTFDFHNNSDTNNHNIGGGPKKRSSKDAVQILEEVPEEVVQAAVERRSSVRRQSLLESGMTEVRVIKKRGSFTPPSSFSLTPVESPRRFGAVRSSSVSTTPTGTGASLRKSMSLITNRLKSGSQGGAQELLDTDGDADGVDKGDGLTLTSLSAKEETEEERKANELQAYRQAFDLLDTDLSGSLSVDEIEDAMTALGKKPPSKEVLHALVTAADLDGNGEVDFEEFVTMMQQFADPNGDGGNNGASFMEGNGSKDALSLELIDRVMGAFKEQAVRMLKHQAYGGPAQVAPGIVPPRPSRLSLEYFPALPVPEASLEPEEEKDDDLSALAAAATAYGAAPSSPNGTSQLEKPPSEFKKKRSCSSAEDVTTEDDVYNTCLAHSQASELAFQILMANGSLETLELGEQTVLLRAFVDQLASAYGDSTDEHHDEEANLNCVIGDVGELGGFGTTKEKAYCKRGDGGAPFHGWHRAVDVALTIHHLLHAMEGYLNPSGYSNENEIGILNASFNGGGPQQDKDKERRSSLFHGVSEELYLKGKKSTAIRVLSSVERLALFLAALGHGLGHDGFSTAYHVQKGTPVAIFFNDHSPNENRTLAILFELLGSPPSNHTSSVSSTPSKGVGSSSPQINNSLVAHMEPKKFRALRKSLVRCFQQSSVGTHAARVSSLRLFAFEHGAKPPPAAAAAAAAASTNSTSNNNPKVVSSGGSEDMKSPEGTMSPQAAAFAAASAAKRSCDLLRATFGEVLEGKSREKKDKARIVIQQTVLHCALLCTTACRSKNHDAYRMWTDRQNREWWRQAKLEQALGFNTSTPFAAAAAIEAKDESCLRPTPKEIAEIEMGLFEQVLLPFLVPLFDVFPPTRFLAGPLAENHAQIATARRKELSIEYRRAERRLLSATEVTARLVSVARAPRRGTNTFRVDRDTLEISKEAKEASLETTSSPKHTSIRENSADDLLGTEDVLKHTLPTASGARKGSIRRTSSGTNWLFPNNSKDDGGKDKEEKPEPAPIIRKSAAAHKWAAGLRWATERDNKEPVEKKEENETPSFGWPKMSELRANATAAAAAAKSRQLAVQKARLHLEARAAAFAETLAPYVGKKDNK